jgi:hypothetical protein
MPDREPGRDRSQEHELKRELRELGASIEYPPTPDLSRAGRRSLEEEQARDTSRSRSLWATHPALRWTAAAVFVLVVAIPTLSPGLRATVANWFVAGQAASTGQEDRAVGGAGRAAKVSPPGRLAEEAARPTSGGSTRPLGDDLGFGERISLREAEGPILSLQVVTPTRSTSAQPNNIANAQRSSVSRRCLCPGGCAS